MTATIEAPADPVEAMVSRLFVEGVGALHMVPLYLGVRLGLFRALAEAPGLDARGLAGACAVDERYAREWAQAETLAGLLIADTEDYATAQFRLADGVQATLVDETNAAYLGGLPMAVAAVGTAVGRVLEAFRTGAGVPMDAYGPEVVHAQAALNRPAFVNELGSSWLPQLPGLHARLGDAEHPARVADVGCGTGWSSIELAKAYPHITVDGFDADTLSVDEARHNAEAHGVADRVRFHEVDVTDHGYGESGYDALLFFECVHDFGRPVEALAGARAAVKDDGWVVVMDERTADRPQVGDPVETFFGCASVAWCLPQSRVVPECEAPGTVMRPATLEGFARRAGWAGVEILPIEHPFFRFYRLVG
jgi:SAM-dependent methyltransferase